MKGKASDICPKCKHCEGFDMFAMYSCKHYNNYPDAAIGMDSEIECCNFEIEGKANDKCPRCKHCLGMTPKGMYSCGYANDGSELNIGVNVVLNCANFEEVNMNKVEGKVGDFCLNCKNCKAVTRMHDGETASIRIIEVDCEDPYDGMVKTLDVDSDICCSMFEPNSPCDKISLLQHELEMEKLRMKIHQLEKEKAAHLKGIERLKKSQEKLQSQVKNLKVYSEENGTMYKEIQEWREKCIARGIDVDHLLSLNKKLDKKISELNQTISDQEITIKALLITIKEMCKEDETNE